MMRKTIVAWFLTGAVLAAVAAQAAPVMLSVIDGTPAAGASGFPGGNGRGRIPVDDDGTVWFLTETSGFSLLDPDDPGSSWDLYRSLPGTGPRAFSLGAAAGLGDAVALAEAGSVIVELRNDTAIPPRSQTLRLLGAAPGIPASTVPGGSRNYLDPSLSHNGRWLVFTADDVALPALGDTNGLADVFLLDTTHPDCSGLRLVSTRSAKPAAGYTPGDCSRPTVSATYPPLVVFDSADNGLVSGDDTTGIRDIFLWDGGTARIRKLSLRPGGKPCDQPSRQPAIAAAGRFVAFASRDSGLVSNDTNGKEDIFVLAPGTGAMTRVSVTTAGEQAAGDCSEPDLSADGRFVLFRSAAPNFPGARANVWQVYLYDRDEGRLECISRAADGTGADSNCFFSTISPSGRYVTFSSTAANLAGPSGGNLQVFRVDRGAGFANHTPVAIPFSAMAVLGNAEQIQCGVMLGGSDADSTGTVFSCRLESLPETGTLTDAGGAGVAVGNILSTSQLPLQYTAQNTTPGSWVSFQYSVGDGIAWSAPATVWIQLGTPAAGSVAPASVTDSGMPGGAQAATTPCPAVIGDPVAMSGNGRFTVFASAATNLTADGLGGVFLHDNCTGRTWRLPPTTAVTGNWGVSPCLAADGSAVAYVANHHLYRVQIRDDGSPGQCLDAGVVNAGIVAISGDGRRIVFDSNSRLAADDTDNATDIYLWEPDDNRLTRISVDAAGRDALAPCYEPCLSADGRFVAFFGDAEWGPAGDWSSPLALWIKDLATGELAPVAAVDPDWAVQPSLSASGRLVAWADGSDVSVVQWSCASGSRELLRLAGASYPRLADNGRYLYFVSARTDLPLDAGSPALPAVSPAVAHAYCWDLAAGTATLLSVSAAGEPGDGDCFCGALSADGTLATFATAAGNLAPDFAGTGSSILTVFHPSAPSAAGPVTCAITLNVGWNLVSLPLEPDITRPEELFRTAGILGPTWQWDARRHAYRQLSMPGAGDGFWVYVTAAVHITDIRGYAPLPALREIRLAVGWNLVGCPTDAPVTLPATMSPWEWTRKTFGVTGHALMPGKGYWICSPAVMVLPQPDPPR